MSSLIDLGDEKLATTLVMMPTRLMTWIAVGLSSVLLCAADGGTWPGLQTDRFELVESEGEFYLKEARELPIPIPREWLIPEAELAQAEHRFVAGFDYAEQVSSFPMGDGLLGLHLSSYEIQRSGSAMATDGRDVFLIFDPASRETRFGLALPSSKWRVRVGGCFAAYHTRLLVGDVDCDRRLDLATLVTRRDCDPSPGESGVYSGYLRSGPLHWYLQTETAWSHDSSYDERLPCAGHRDLPLIGLVKHPVQYVLERIQSEAPLLNRSVFIPAAGLAMSIPAEWRLDLEPKVSEMRAYGRAARLRVRLTRNEEGVDLRTWLDGYLANERFMAATVKDNLHRFEIETEPFPSSTRIAGYRSLFGWAASDPSRITYFLANLDGDFVQIHLELSQDKTADVWRDHDRRILGSLELRPASQQHAASEAPP